MATRLDHDQSVVALYDPTVTGKASLSIQPDTFVAALTTPNTGIRSGLKYSLGGTSRLTETAKTLHCAKSRLASDDIVATYKGTDQSSFTVNQFTHVLDDSPTDQAGPLLASHIHEAILQKAYAEAKASLDAYEKDKSAAHKEDASQKLLVLRTIHHCLKSKLEAIIDPEIRENLSDSLICYSHENLFGDEDSDLGRTFRIPRSRLPDLRPLGRDRAAAHEGTAASYAEDEEPARITEKDFIQLIYRDFLLKPKGTEMPDSLRDLARGNTAFERLLEQAIEAKARNSDGTLADNAKAALKCLTRGVHHTGRFIRDLFDGPHDPLAIAARASALDRSSWTLPPKTVLDHRDLALEALVDLPGETFEDIEARKEGIEEYAERALGFIGKICFEQSLEAKTATLDAKLAHAGTRRGHQAVDQLGQALDHLSEKVFPILHRLDELADRYATPEKRSAIVQAFTSLTPAERVARTSKTIQQAVDKKLGPAIAHVGDQLLSVEPLPTPSIDSAELLVAKFPRKEDGAEYPHLTTSNPHFARLRDASEGYDPRDLTALLDRGLAHTLQNAPNKKELKLCILNMQRRLKDREVTTALRAAPKGYGELITELKELLKHADSAIEHYPRDPTERANHFYTIALALQAVNDSIVHLFTPVPREGGAVSPLTHYLQVIRESQTGIEETSRRLAEAMRAQTTATTQVQRDAATARIGDLNRHKTLFQEALTDSKRALDDLTRNLARSENQLHAALSPDGTKAVWVDPAARRAAAPAPDEDVDVFVDAVDHHRA